MSRKEKALSFAFLAFFAFNVFQQYGRQETWPFSFFGMYQDTVPGDFVSRFDLDYIPPGGEPESLFKKANGYYLTDKFREIAAGRTVSNRNEVLTDEGELHLNDEVLGKIREVLVSDILPDLERKGALRVGGRIRLRYQMWRDFEPARRYRPDKEVIIWDSPVTDLRGAL